MRAADRWDPSTRDRYHCIHWRTFQRFHWRRARGRVILLRCSLPICSTELIPTWIPVKSSIIVTIMAEISVLTHLLSRWGTCYWRDRQLLVNQMTGLFLLKRAEQATLVLETDILIRKHRQIDILQLLLCAIGRWSFVRGPSRTRVKSRRLEDRRFVAIPIVLDRDSYATSVCNGTTRGTCRWFDCLVSLAHVDSFKRLSRAQGMRR